MLNHMEELRASFLKNTLLTSTTPFIVKGICLFLENLQEILFKYLNISEEYDLTSSIRKLNQLIFCVYNNFIIFIGTMIALNVIITLIKTGKESSQNQQVDIDSPKDTLPTKLKAQDKNKIKIKQEISRLSKLLICYTVIFCCLQFIFLITSSLFDQSTPVVFQTTDHNRDQPQVHIESHRHLEQISNEEALSEKLMLNSAHNIGEVLGSFSYGDSQGSQRVTFTISKDGKTLFALEGSKLSIFDISDPKQRKTIHSFLNLESWKWISMILSPDEQLLFILTDRYLMIINTSDQKEPNILYKNLGSSLDQGFSSLTISSDGKILYALTEKSLNIYNVSQPKNPELLYKKNYEIKKATICTLANDSPRIAISQNGTILALASVSTFEILNVEDPRKPIPIYSVDSQEIEARVFSITFSEEKNKILLGVLWSCLHQFVVIFDITNPRVIKPDLSLVYEGGTARDVYSAYANIQFHKNQNFAFFYTRNEFKILSLADMEHRTIFSSPIESQFRPLTISADGTRCVIYFSGRIIIAKFNIDLSPKSFPHFKPNALKVINEVSYDRKLAIAISDRKYVYLLGDTGANIYRALMPFQRLSKTSFQSLQDKGFFGSFGGEKEAIWDILARKNIVVVKDLTKRGESTLALFNVTDKNNITQFKGPRGIVSLAIPAFTISEDEKIFAFILDDWRDRGNATLNIIMTWDLDNFTLTNFPLALSEKRCSLNRVSSMKISLNNGLLFYANCDLLIYNIADTTSPILGSSYNLGVSQTIGMILSKNEKLLYHFGLTSDNKKKLQVLDVSSPKSPNLLSSILLEQSTESTNSIELSPDEKILYLGFMNGMLMIDVQIHSQPILLGFNYYYEGGHALKFVPSEKLFYIASVSGVTAIDLTSQYILDLKNSDFKIGESYSVSLNVLKLNKNLKFDYLTKRYKFLKVTLFDSKSFSKAEYFTNLPSWITFDQERSLLIVDPKSALNNGTYKISVAVSIQTQASAFVGLESIPTENEASELMLTLLQYGYLDRQRCISEVLDFDQELSIGSKYQKINKEIRAILAQHYIEAIGEFSVSPSLNISLETRPLKISTLSKGIISVAIELNRTKTGKNPYFLTKTYSNVKSTITNKRSLLLLDGSLENINEALKEVSIDLDEAEFCHGMINITDNMNAPISHSISFLSNYFISNETIFISEERPLTVSSPSVDHLTVTIQLDFSNTSQEYQAHFVAKTYKFVRFNIMNNKTLILFEGLTDDINEALQEVLVDLGKLEGYSGGTVSVTDNVNPPKSQHKFDLTRYFQNNTEPYYNLDISIQKQMENKPFYTGLYSSIELNSSTFIENNSLPLEYFLQMQVSGEQVPSWISFSSLSLTLAGTPPEKYSPLSYDFVLVVKNEFREVRAPFTLKIKISFFYGIRLASTYGGYLVSLIGLIYSINKVYNIVARKYYRYPRSFRLKIGEQITDQNIFPILLIDEEVKESQIIFKDLQKYITQNQQKIKGEYQNLLLDYFIDPQLKILEKEKIISTLEVLNNNYYNQAHPHSRDLIQRLVINMIIMKQLTNKQETITRDIFNKIKDRWMDFVIATPLPSQFMIDSDKLEQELSNFPSLYQREDDNLLLAKNQLNIDFLKDIILAHAFTFQTLDSDPISIKVISYQKLKGKSLLVMIKRLLLRDLKHFISIGKREIGYGIKYKIDENTLHFSGKLTSGIKDNIIVVHLKNSKDRILREIWITGESITKKNHEESYIELVSETL